MLLVTHVSGPADRLWIGLSWRHNKHSTQVSGLPGWGREPEGWGAGRLCVKKTCSELCLCKWGGRREWGGKRTVMSKVGERDKIEIKLGQKESKLCVNVGQYLISDTLCSQETTPWNSPTITEASCLVWTQVIHSPVSNIRHPVFSRNNSLELFNNH